MDISMSHPGLNSSLSHRPGVVCHPKREAEMKQKLECMETNQSEIILGEAT